MRLCKETAVELFDIQVRALIASIHANIRKEPDEKAWQMIRGEREITARDLGEISALGDFRLELRIETRDPETDEAVE